MTAIADHHTAETTHLASADYVALDEEWSTHNYHPLPVVISHGEGSWVTDVEGRRYLEFRALVRDVRSGRGVNEGEALGAYATTIEVRLARAGIQSRG